MPPVLDKTLEQPGWATVDEVIGYTFKLKLTPALIQEIGVQSRRELNSRWKWSPKPSVYYKQGHATLQHDSQDNLGWTKSNHWRWLYFGNVPKNVAHQPGHQEQQQGDKREPRIQFADRVRRNHGSYSWSDGVQKEWSLMGDPSRGWKTNDSATLPTDAVLLEIWVQQRVKHAFAPTTVVPRAVMAAHPSRNRFYWVADDEPLRQALHALATEWIEMVGAHAEEMTVGKKKWTRKV